MTKTLHSIGDELVNLLTSPEGHQMLADIGEAVIDRELIEGFVKDTPVLSVFFSLVKIGGSIPDIILAKKIHSFLSSSFSEIDKDILMKTIDRLEGDEVYGRRVGEHIIEQLDRMDSHVKPTLLAKTFSAYAKEEIDRDDFLSLINAIELIHINDIQILENSYKNKAENNIYIDHDSGDPALSRLHISGLLLADSGGYGIGVAYFPNDLGRLFIKTGLTKPESS